MRKGRESPPRLQRKKKEKGTSGWGAHRFNAGKTQGGRKGRCSGLLAPICRERKGRKGRGGKTRPIATNNQEC